MTHDQRTIYSVEANMAVWECGLVECMRGEAREKNEEEREREEEIERKNA